MPPEYLLSIIPNLLFGCLSAYFAHRQKRNVYLWFFIGLLLAGLGFFAFFFIPQFKKKRPIAEKRTDPIAYLEGSQDKFWYYLDSQNNRYGPMSFIALEREWKQGKINRTTYVWNEELPDWQPLENFMKVRKNPVS